LFGLDADTITVATASRLSPEKGLDFLLEAARLAPEVLFLIAGDGPQREPVAQHSPANVRLLGRIESVPELLAAADIACVPSLTEGQGIFALEAMAASLPVVASNVGGLPEMIDDAVTGFLVAPASPAAIVEAIRRLADSPQLRTVLGANASRHAEKIGDIYGMVRKVEDVYATVLASWR